MLRLNKKSLPLYGLALMLLLSLLGLVWQPYPLDSIDIAERFVLPSWQNWLGKDYLGRDILSLLLYGMGQSLAIACLAIIPASLCALLCGFFASKPTIIGHIINLLASFLFAFPVIISAIFIAAHFGAGRYVPIFAIALFTLPVLIRVTRSQIFTLQSRDFITAARAMGASEWQLFYLYYLPNIKKPLLVQIASLFAIAILTEAGLSYLGFGAAPDQHSLGKMLFDAQRFSHLAPHMAIFPGLALSLIIININGLIDAYNEDKPLLELRF